MPRRLKSMTHGVLPPYAQFTKDVRRADEDGKPYWAKGEPFRMEFAGHEAELLADYGNFTQRAGKYGHKLGAQMNERQMYGFVKYLSRQGEKGDDQAASLASGIMSTLGYDWV